MSTRRMHWFTILAASLCPMDWGAPLDDWGTGDSPGTWAPRYNQRKARKKARRMGRRVRR